LGIDLGECGAQTGELAVKILDGTKVQDVAAVYPSKIAIILNKKTADKEGIVFSPETLGVAWKVYTTDIFDPEPKWIGQDKEK